jgi:adenylyl- and sulfurtransferase ThiI
MKLALENFDVEISKNRVRMFIEPKNENIDEIVNIVKNIFGIHSIVVAYKVKTNIEIIKAKIQKEKIINYICDTAINY